MAEVGTCGDSSRPSRDEVAALACAMLDSMLSIDGERPRNDDNVFMVSQSLGRESFVYLI